MPRSRWPRRARRAASHLPTPLTPSSTPADTVSYLHDAAVTLVALCAAHNACASALLSPDHGALLAAVARTHDALLPQLAAALQQPAAAAAAAEPGSAGAPARLARLRSRLQQLAAVLLVGAFTRPLQRGGRGENGGGRGQNGGAAERAAESAECRGSELMTLVLSVSDPDAGSAQLLAAANTALRIDVDVAAAMRA
eukprot:142371-Chlamydomonas_euryale.AAC.1